MQFYEFNDVEERVILIGVQTSEDEDVARLLTNWKNWRRLPVQ